MVFFYYTLKLFLETKLLPLCFIFPSKLLCLFLLKSSLHPSSRKILFATDKAHYRKPQQTKMHSSSPVPVDTLSKHSCTKGL